MGNLEVSSNNNELYDLDRRICRKVLLDDEVLASLLLICKSVIPLIIKVIVKKQQNELFSNNFVLRSGISDVIVTFCIILLFGN